MIQLASYGTVSDFEILLVVISFVGLCFSTYTARQAWKDYQALCAEPRETRGLLWFASHMLSKVWVVSECGRIYLQFIFLVLGAYYLTFADPTRAGLPQWREIMSVILQWLFITGAAATAGKSIYVWYVRMRLQEDAQLGIHTNGNHINDKKQERETNS